MGKIIISFVARAARAATLAIVDGHTDEHIAKLV